MIFAVPAVNVERGWVTITTTVRTDEPELGVRPDNLSVEEFRAALDNPYQLIWNEHNVSPPSDGDKHVVTLNEDWQIVPSRYTARWGTSEELYHRVGCVRLQAATSLGAVPSAFECKSRLIKLFGRFFESQESFDDNVFASSEEDADGEPKFQKDILYLVPAGNYPLATYRTIVDTSRGADELAKQVL